MGLGSSSLYIDYRGELSKLELWIKNNPQKTKTTKVSKIDWLISAYSGMKLIEFSRQALLRREILLIAPTGYAAAKPVPSSCLGLAFENVADQTTFTTCFRPLLEYLLKIRTGYQTIGSDYLSVDTNRVRKTVAGVARIDLQSRLLSEKLPEPFFQWFVVAVRAEIDSNGQRIGISPDLKSAIRAEKCFACLEVLGADWEAGHLKAVNHGGVNDRTNLRPLCSKCNRGMKDQHLEEYIVRNQLPGLANLAPERRSLWIAIVALTEEAAKYEPAVRSQPADVRLGEISRIVRKVLL